MKNLIFIILIFLLYNCNQVDKKYYHGLFPVEEYGYWGYIDTKGQKQIACKFDEVKVFSEGLAAVKIDSLWGFIDTSGNMVIKPQFFYVNEFSNNLSLVLLKIDTINQYAYIRKNGEIAFKCVYDNCGDFHDGRAYIKKNNSISYIDTIGNTVFDTNGSYGSSRYHEGMTRVDEHQEDSARIINIKGETIFKTSNTDHGQFSGGLMYLNSEKIYVDKQGKSVIANLKKDYDYSDFSDGLAQITKNAKTGFIDKSGRVKIPIEYEVIRDFKEGRAAFYNGEKWGFINKNADTIIQPIFDGVDDKGFENGLCKVFQKRSNGYINRKGTFVWQNAVDILYKKIDTSRWNLDTLKTKRQRNYGGKVISWRNPIRAYKGNLKEYLFVDTSKITVFKKRYLAYKLYMVNNSKDTIDIPAQTGMIKIIQQALNEKGKWIDIEAEFNSFCGNEYHNIHFYPCQYIIFAAPITNGKFKTKLRFRLKTATNEVLYSNEYYGKINKKRFIESQTDTGTALWAF